MFFTAKVRSSEEFFLCRAQRNKTVKFAVMENYDSCLRRFFTHADS